MASSVLTGFAARQNSGFLSGTSEIEAQLLEGTIGEAATIELIAFLRLFRQLPSIPEILLNPDTAPVPVEPSARIAIATALGRIMWYLQFFFYAWGAANIPARRFYVLGGGLVGLRLGSGQRHAKARCIGYAGMTSSLLPPISSVSKCRPKS
jgi:hypothetical protein